MTCPECGAPMVFRPASRYGPFYGCSAFPDCRVTHGAHPDGSALGTPADIETRRWRIAAHDWFDCIWRGSLSEYTGPGRRSDAQLQRIARNRCYAFLADRLGMTRDECHIGLFDAKECRDAIQALVGVDYAQVRSWYKANHP